MECRQCSGFDFGHHGSCLLPFRHLRGTLEGRLKFLLQRFAPLHGECGDHLQLLHCKTIFASAAHRSLTMDSSSKERGIDTTKDNFRQSEEDYGQQTPPPNAHLTSSQKVRPSASIFAARQKCPGWAVTRISFPDDSTIALTDGRDAHQTKK